LCKMSSLAPGKVSSATRRTRMSVIAMAQGLPIAAFDSASLFGGGEHGYTDYQRRAKRPDSKRTATETLTRGSQRSGA
jgi:hypothetical protein